MKHKLRNFARQLGLMLLVIWTVVSLVTLLIELVPGDPATTILGETATPEQIANFNEKHGLDRPAFFISYSSDSGFVWNGTNNRYFDYFSGLLRGDLGRSFRTDRPVLDMIFERYPSTIQLALASMFVAIGIAIPLGVLAGTNKNGLIDNFASFIALLGISLPTFVIGPFLVYIFAVNLRWFSPTGSANPEDIVLPAVTLGAALSAILTRMVRSSVIEELGEDYVRTARAKGLSETQVTMKHAFRNALIPLVTLVALNFGALLAGAVVTETVFALDGMGLYFINALGVGDPYPIMAWLMVTATIVVVFNLIADITYGYLDPRVRYD
jgi:ABC-type dipeptide/oligopeptide/nickel transport system permease component